MKFKGQGEINICGFEYKKNIADSRRGGFRAPKKKPVSAPGLQGIYAEIHGKCKFSTEEDRKVTLDDIKETLKYIKSRKADGGLISDHLLLASDIFLQQLALMLTSILTHGYQPKDMLLGTITSIPKDSRGTVHL